MFQSVIIIRGSLSVESHHSLFPSIEDKTIER